MRRAKIIATLGTSLNVDMASQLIRSGMNVARLNMGHLNHKECGNIIDNVRKASKKTGWEIGILMDLQGPKIRVVKLDKPIHLKKGEIWTIGHMDEKGTPKEKFIPTTYKNLVSDCHDGARILFDDGLIVAQAKKRVGLFYEIEIKHGGILKSSKGINLPDCIVSAPSFTQKDCEDLTFGLKKEIDYVALSFVRCKEDIDLVKDFLTKKKKDIPIIAKIESTHAVKNIEEIIHATDIIMLARGDMGVEIGNHVVPTIQKKIINLCNHHRTPVITATQMLESMMSSVVPTRAEASDVANAIWDGTDAVMLSGETAVGLYPEKTIEMMVEIIKEAEKTQKERTPLRHLDLSSVDDSIMVAASLVAEKIDAVRIIAMTQSGNSCSKLSHFRPVTRIIGVTNSLAVVRKICLYWGVTPYLLSNNEKVIHTEDHQKILQKIKEDCKLSLGDKVVLTKGEGKIFKQEIGSANSLAVRFLI